jgi:hypothetical protein
MSAHTLSLVVWAAIALGCAALWITSRAAPRRVARLGPIVDALMARPFARLVVVLGWMWFGWHTFAR